MIDQPPTATLLSLITVELDRLARQPPGRPLDDGDRYTLRVVANLSRILRRELGPSIHDSSTLVESIQAANEAVGPPSATPAASGRPLGLDDLGQLVVALDDTLRTRLIRTTVEGDAPPPWTVEQRRQLHGQLLRAVVKRLEVNRPGYARPVHRRADVAHSAP